MKYKEGKTVRLNLRMTQSQFDAMKVYAEGHALSVSEIVRQGIALVVENNNRQENQQVEQGESQTQGEV